MLFRILFNYTILIVYKKTTEWIYTVYMCTYSLRITNIFRVSYYSHNVCIYRSILIIYTLYIYIYIYIYTIGNIIYL